MLVLPTEVRVRIQDQGQTGAVTDAPTANGKVAVYWGRADKGARITIEEVDNLVLAPPLSIPDTDKPPEVAGSDL